MSDKPEVISNLKPEQLVQLDVRPVLAGGTEERGFVSHFRADFDLGGAILPGHIVRV